MNIHVTSHFLAIPHLYGSVSLKMLRLEYQILQVSLGDAKLSDTQVGVDISQRNEGVEAIADPCNTP